MNLKDERDQWLEEYKAGKCPEILDIYKIERDSELWRSGSIVEELCEYILYLESTR